MHDKPLTITELSPGKKQTEWRWQAAVNFIMGGAGTGFYALSVIALIYDKGSSLSTLPVPFGLLGPVLTVIGLAVLVTEAGRPLRGRFLIHRLQSSWISREVLAGGIFILSVALDSLFPHLVFKMSAVLGAFIFMLSQGFIVYSARALPAWNVPVTPIFFLTSGFSSGAGVALLLAASVSLWLLDLWVFIALICAILNLTVWILYLRSTGAADFRSATATPKRPRAVVLAVGLGHLFPLSLLLLMLVSGFLEMDGFFTMILSTVSGAALILGVIVQKSFILFAAGYTRAIVL